MARDKAVAPTNNVAAIDQQGRGRPPKRAQSQHSRRCTRPPSSSSDDSLFVSGNKTTATDSFAKARPLWLRRRTRQRYRQQSVVVLDSCPLQISSALLAALLPPVVVMSREADGRHFPEKTEQRKKLNKINKNIKTTLSLSFSLSLSPYTHIYPEKPFHLRM